MSFDDVKDMSTLADKYSHDIEASWLVKISKSLLVHKFIKPYTLQILLPISLKCKVLETVLQSQNWTVCMFVRA